MLRKALASYSFPYAVYNFSERAPMQLSDMTDVEEYIQGLLHSQNEMLIKHGLANILYWGYGQMGIRDTRVTRFLDGITSSHLHQFYELVQSNALSCSSIKSLGMPEYSGMSFITKVLMFHDPKTYCILDNQILKMRDGSSQGSLNRLKKSSQEKLIRISKNNERCYLDWCEECRALATKDGLGNHRAVDAERAFFALIQSGKHELAKSLYDQFCGSKEPAGDLFNTGTKPAANIWTDVDV